MERKLVFISCHRLPERSFFWRGRQFPLCARCTGLYAGYLSFPLFNFELVALNSLYALLMTLPLVIDGLLQAFLAIPSNNLRRVVTGILAGIGLMAMVVNAGTLLGNLILH